MSDNQDSIVLQFNSDTGEFNFFIRFLARALEYCSQSQALSMEGLCLESLSSSVEWSDNANVM
jgi:hypothetical protein